MNFAAIGVPGLLIILVIILMLFGPRKLPEIGGAVGKTLSEFKKSAKDVMDDEETDTKKASEAEKRVD
ncbi:twin-arginine translocase TatA/TatE family subunit [Sporosarcina trichiuri]|uniref:twin-arginine translocase TatA/TatE family subunit n=1 Tax=Sporosarcina trichiuri TaxID=3056445 RepID=UPI0025B50650|nr:twin-arginine translocase TatA/TatE family subunit [Sporosarcina sp. 0.2-SM1T-5]WJY26363.1 twin-arginine translocase TatA/TatE family subunit [Sporosarcina sp. 0.2-SM1T-5]